MPININVKNRRQAIVPIRFARAVTGAPNRSAPDIDDRSFHMGNRPGNWGQSTTRGAMIAVAVGDTVRVKILREDIESSAQLYITSSDSTVVEVVAPSSGQPLAANDEIRIKGIADKKNTPVSIRVHYGSDSGPVIGELEPHVFALIRLRVAIHLVDIYGGDTARWAGTTAASQPAMVALLTRANDIWRPAGIEFRTDNLLVRRESVRRNPANAARSQYLHRASGQWRNLPAPLGANGNFTTAGTITDQSAWANQWREFDTLINLNFVNNRVNVYCVQVGTGWVGLSYVGTNNGLAISDAASNFDLAHELGHYLNNDHADENNANNDQDPKDIWLTRRLMYSDWPAAAPPFRNDLGYGSGQYGALLSVKKLNGNYSNADGEVNRSRTRARRPFS